MGGQGISTDLDTITVPSPLLPHHFWPCSCRAAGNRKAQLSGRRFGQSGIKCRALFSHSAPGVGTPRDLHCAFSHTSLGGAAVILSLRKGRAEKQEREAGRGPEMEGVQRNGRGGRVGLRKIEDGRRESMEQSQSGGYCKRSSGSLRAAPRKTTSQQKDIRHKHVSFFTGPGWLLVFKGPIFWRKKKNHQIFLIIYNSSQLRI